MTALAASDPFLDSARRVKKARLAPAVLPTNESNDDPFLASAKRVRAMRMPKVDFTQASDAYASTMGGSMGNPQRPVINPPQPVAGPRDFLIPQAETGLAGAWTNIKKGVAPLVKHFGGVGAEFAERQHFTPRGEGVGGFVGDVAGSVIQAAPAMVNPALAGPVIANFAGQAAAQKMDETGNPSAASGCVHH